MSKRIILADDEAHVLDVLSMKLKRAGFEVETASDGARALEMCKQQPPDLLITDCQMPVMDGLELCGKLREDPATGRIPTVMLTAREFEISADDARKRGIEHLVPKPFSPRQILELAGKVLSGGSDAVAVKVQPEPNQQPGTGDPTGVLVEVYNQVRDRAVQLNINATLWDLRGRRHEDHFCNSLCSKLCGSQAGCGQAAQAAAEQALAEGKPCSRLLENEQCAVLALPVEVEGRSAGLISLSVPLTGPADGVRVRQLMESCALSESEAQDLVKRSCTFSAAQADGVLSMLSWVVQGQQEVAQRGRQVKNLSSNLSLTYEELDLVYQLSSAVRVTKDPQTFLRGVLDRLLEVLDMGGAAVVVYPHSGDQDEQVLVAGHLEISQQQVQALAAGQIAPNLAGEKTSWICNDFAAAGDAPVDSNIKQVLAARMDGGEGSLGMVLCFNRAQNDFDSVDAKLITSVAAQCATFLSNQRLYSDLEELFWGVLRALTASIDAKDAYTGQHSDRVAELSQAVARGLGLDEKQCEDIYLAGMLHDIGKIGVPEAILRKPGRLDDEEFAELKKHPHLGGKILEGIRQLEGVVEGIVSHHERPDGRGYPKGLSGEDIPIAGRIIAMADSFDAMTSNRPYRDALSMDVVLEEIRKGSGSQFDEKVVEVVMSLDLDAYRE
jgi:response regulator RpfG family c-di-GMP phosphodiesterase